MLKDSKITKISLEEFEGIIATLNPALYTKKGWNDFEWCRDIDAVAIKDCWILKKWSVGGQSGGSCWGTEHYAVPGEPESEFSALDDILMEVVPDISFLEYKKFINNVNVTESSERDSDYYNNWTQYAIKALNIEDIYNCLREMAE